MNQCVPPAGADDVDRLNLSVQPFLERNIQAAIDCVDDVLAEQQKVRGVGVCCGVWTGLCSACLLADVMLAGMGTSVDAGQAWGHRTFVQTVCGRERVHVEPLAFTWVGFPARPIDDATAKHFMHSTQPPVTPLLAPLQVTMYHKTIARQAQQMATWLQKRRAENQVRTAAVVACIEISCNAWGMTCPGKMLATDTCHRPRWPAAGVLCSRHSLARGCVTFKFPHALSTVKTNT